ncbi:hypothetical protein BRC62_00345 [Halobacteriales archaeon QH_10_67_13]|nr:MAG: hypothetical protein BRC62_00345 [Halobacteriales archaeon QH_10_67_13]
MSTREEYRDAAIAALGERAYERAGNEYTRAAWLGLAEPREDVNPFTVDERGWVGRGLSHLVTAAAGYRVAGADARATRRGVEGVAVARDLRGSADPVQRACLEEFVADFRAIAGLDGAVEAYETAAQAYRTAAEGIDDPQTKATTPLFEAAAAPLKQLARSQANGEIAVTWEDLHGSDPNQPGAFLAHRAEYKRQRLPGLIEQTVADGYLAAPRGSTAYDTDTYRCPACGSRDVNWVGASTLCLRCSRPVEE